MDPTRVVKHLSVRRNDTMINYRTRNITVFVLVVILTSCLGVTGNSNLDEAEKERKRAEGLEYTQKTVLVGSVSVSVPAGRFLLVRNGNDACAVRFTSFDGREETAYHGEYDWYFQSDGTGNFTKPSLKAGHGKITVYLGRILWAFSAHHVLCGPFRLLWDYPTHLGFAWTTTREADVGNEIAPTKWTDISEVNIHDPRLKWYRRVDAKREIRIPIDKLW